MFGMKKREITKSDVLLKEISDLLFPPFHNEELNGEKYAIDSSVDTNIDAVLTDLKDGYLDQVCIESLQTIFEKLNKTRELLKAFHYMDSNITKYIIAMQIPKNVIDEIEPLDEEIL
jgi:hypothetical protein